MDDNQYFATLKPNELVDALTKRKDEYYRYLDSSGRRILLQSLYNAYHRPGLENGHLTEGGDQGELLQVCVNHFRNLLQHRLVMTTSQRPMFEPKAINTDSESMDQVRLAASLLEYYERVKKMERYTAQATEYAIVFGEGFVSVGWNPTIGEVYSVDPKTGRGTFEGDLDFKAYHTFDVIRDVAGYDSQSWYIVRNYVNKFDLAAKYPDLADRILNEVNDTYLERYKNFSFWYKSAPPQLEDNTMIPLYTFMHKKSEALPAGRLTQYVGCDTVLIDGPLPYEDVPVYRIAGSEQERSINGYSMSFDLLPLQELLDRLYSVVSTNQNAFGVQNIGIPKGSGIDIQSLAGGLNLIEFDPAKGPPIPINLTGTPKEVFDFIDGIKQDMEVLAGVSSVDRGSPEASLRSASALALVQAKAVEFAQGLQLSYTQLLEDIGTTVIKILQEYASTPRVALIAGKNNRSALKSFTGADIKNVTRVFVDVGNPVMRTTAGRVNIAEQLVQAGLVQTPQQYLEVLATGRLEPMYEGQLAELSLIRSENEKLSAGEQQPVIRTDNHALHITEHKAVLASPDARANTEVVTATLLHIQQHEQLMGPVGQVPAEQQAAPQNGTTTGTTGAAQTEPTVQQQNANIQG